MRGEALHWLPGTRGGLEAGPCGEAVDGHLPSPPPPPSLL